jgi:hypothetical protein
MTTIKPIGAYATIQYKDEPDVTIGGYYFSFGEYDEEVDEDNDSYGMPDSEIFFYCDGEHALKSYMTAGMEDFVVISYELAYDDRDIEHALLINELEHNK